jgi:hypothetical protein
MATRYASSPMVISLTAQSLNLHTHQLQWILTETSIWTQRRLTDSTTTARVDMHTLDSLTHPTPSKTTLTKLPDGDLNKTPGTAPRHHLSHQRSSTNTTLLTTTPCRPFLVAPLSNDRPPRGASRVTSPGQAWLQIFDLATNCWNSPMNQSDETR